VDTGVPRHRAGKGSLLRERWAVIAGGLVVVALIAVLMAATASVDSFLYLGLDTLKRHALGHLAADVTPPRRAELVRAFDTVIAGATARRLTEEQVGTFARACRAALADGSISAAEAGELRDLAHTLDPHAGR
jgi:hypothetical protein